MILSKQLLLISLLWLGGSGSAFAYELGLGLAAVEEGDDRQRPAALLHVAWHDDYFSRLFVYGRDFGPVSERTMLFSTGYNLDVFRMFDINFIHGAIGAAVLYEQTKISFPGDKVNSSTEENFNLGALVGVYADLPQVPAPIFVRFSLESHLFLGNLPRFMLLSTGRKHALSVTVGAMM